MNRGRRRGFAGASGPTVLDRCRAAVPPPAVSCVWGLERSRRSDGRAPGVPGGYGSTSSSREAPKPGPLTLEPWVRQAAAVRFSHPGLGRSDFRSRGIFFLGGFAEQDFFRGILCGESFVERSIGWYFEFNLRLGYGCGFREPDGHDFYVVLGSSF